MNITLKQRIINFSKAIFIWGIHGFRFPKKSVLINRKQKCLGDSTLPKCEHWESNAYLKLGGCGKCGCSKIKLYLKDSSCPIEKW